MVNPILEIIKKRREGSIVGIPSYCSANEIVIEVAIDRAIAHNKPVLIEATTNQVNQTGGYTGMNPFEFVEFVRSIAERRGCPRELLVFGGDHLGLLTWCNLPASEAMEKAEELVRAYIRAGFLKNNIDTSIKIADDDSENVLSTEVIAKRGVLLYKACMEVYCEMLKVNPDCVSLVFVIGSEVPIPGGTTEVEPSINVVNPLDFERTVETYKKIFEKSGSKDGWKDIIAVVIQPGVEFGYSQIFSYDREAAFALC